MDKQNEKKIQVEIDMEHWDTVISPKRNWFDLKLKQLIQYRDLLYMFVKRDVVTLYKQTVLGPIWFFIQPILTMIVYIFIFGKVANISTDSLPQPLFYLSGIVMWNYFSESFNQTSDTFKTNAAIFGKVFFPRLIVPLSKVVSALIKFFIQFVLFLGVFIYYLSIGAPIHPSIYILLLPILLLMMAGLGLGFGLIFTSLTTKYRDFKFLISFGIQLAMYASPVIYPLSTIPEKYQSLVLLNPLAVILEAFKYIFLGAGHFTSGSLIYAGVFTVVVLLLGIVVFNKTEQKFMDTV